MSIREIKNAIRNKIWIFLKAKWRLRSGIIIRVENDSDWFVFNEIFTNKEYDAAFNLFFPYLSPNPLVLDIGANVGYFTLKAADEMLLAGIDNFEFIAVEASAKNFNVLRQRLGQPLLNHKARCFLGLAGHRTGYGKVVSSAQHYGHSSAQSLNVAGATKVDYVDVEKLIQNTSRSIDILKCDIEGSEEIFIASYGDLLKRVDAAVFEFHAGECNIENCRQMLRQSGLFSKGIIKEDPAYKTSVEIFSRQ